MSYYNQDSETYETVKTQLDGIEQEHMDAMHVKEETFIKEMKKRLETYGQDILITQKQQIWLAAIYDRYVNGNKEAGLIPVDKVITDAKTGRKIRRREYN